MDDEAIDDATEESKEGSGDVRQNTPSHKKTSSTIGSLLKSAYQIHIETLHEFESNIEQKTRECHKLTVSLRSYKNKLAKLQKEFDVQKDQLSSVKTTLDETRLQQAAPCGNCELLRSQLQQQQKMCLAVHQFLINTKPAQVGNPIIGQTLEVELEAMTQQLEAINGTNMKTTTGVALNQNSLTMDNLESVESTSPGTNRNLSLKVVRNGKRARCQYVEDAELESKKSKSRSCSPDALIRSPTRGSKQHQGCQLLQPYDTQPVGPYTHQRNCTILAPETCDPDRSSDASLAASDICDVKHIDNSLEEQHPAFHKLKRTKSKPNIIIPETVPFTDFESDDSELEITCSGATQKTVISVVLGPPSNESTPINSSRSHSQVPENNVQDNQKNYSNQQKDSEVLYSENKRFQIQRGLSGSGSPVFGGTDQENLQSPSSPTLFDEEQLDVNRKFSDKRPRYPSADSQGSESPSLVSKKKSCTLALEISADQSASPSVISGQSVGHCKMLNKLDSPAHIMENQDDDGVVNFPNNDSKTIKRRIGSKSRRLNYNLNSSPQKAQKVPLNVKVIKSPSVLPVNRIKRTLVIKSTPITTRSCGKKMHQTKLSPALFSKSESRDKHKSVSQDGYSLSEEEKSIILQAQKESLKSFKNERINIESDTNLNFSLAPKFTSTPVTKVHVKSLSKESAEFKIPSLPRKLHRLSKDSALKIVNAEMDYDPDCTRDPDIGYVIPSDDGRKCASHLRIAPNADSIDCDMLPAELNGSIDPNVRLSQFGTEPLEKEPDVDKEFTSLGVNKKHKISVHHQRKLLELDNLGLLNSQETQMLELEMRSDGDSELPRSAVFGHSDKQLHDRSIDYTRDVEKIDLHQHKHEDVDHHPLDIDDSFDCVPKMKKGPSYAHVNVVLKHDERRKLDAFACQQCDNDGIEYTLQYFTSLGLNDEEKKERMKNCRHKAEFAPPDTPEHYWSVDFPDTQQCADRGYAARTKAQPSKFRRKRKLKQLFAKENNEDDDPNS